MEVSEPSESFIKGKVREVRSSLSDMAVVLLRELLVIEMSAIQLSTSVTLFRVTKRIG